MLDVRPTAYICPIAEQEIGPLTPIVTVQNFADEDARINALFRIYRESLGILEYSSVSATIELDHGQTTSLAALTPFDPGAPADADFFILCELSVQSIPTGQIQYIPLGQYFFDIKPAPMGLPPATHHTTHENGGMDPVDLSGMTGLTGTPQTPANHATTHQLAGSDPLNVAGLHGELADDQPPLTHDAQKHTESTPQVLTDQEPIDWDLDAGGVATVTLAGDRTLNNPTHMINGATYWLRAIQDSQGGRVLTPGNAYRPFWILTWPDLFITNPGYINTVGFICDGSHLDCFVSNPIIP
jgi:hypothetical protein